MFYVYTYKYVLYISFLELDGINKCGFIIDDVTTF